jgi:hypothetical protein
MRISEDAIDFAYKDKDLKYSIYLVLASQFGMYSILLYYTFQMKLLRDSVISQEDSVKMSDEEIMENISRKKFKARLIWGSLQIFLVISYAIKCIEQYYVKFLNESKPLKYLTLSKSIFNILTEFPINLAQLYYMIQFFNLK